MNKENIKQKITDNGERVEERNSLMDDLLKALELGGKDKVKSVIQAKAKVFGTQAEQRKNILLDS
jgi:hypothetical protein|tara:strand:+ start:4394 stop:4588 length:195 start_codon:yes stop_codon:yes gene_type:complete